MKRKQCMGSLAYCECGIVNTEKTTEEEMDTDETWQNSLLYVLVGYFGG